MRPNMEDFFESTRGLRGLHDQKLVEYWKELSSSWSISERVSFAIELVEKNIWLGYPIYDHILNSENPRDSYPLLVKFFGKISAIAFLDNFRIRCETDRSFSREYVKILEQEKTENIAKLSGLILALSFRETPEGRARDWSEIESRLSSTNGFEQLSAAYAIRVLDNNKQTADVPTGLSDRILDHIQENGSPEVKKQLVWFFISHFNPTDKRISDCIETIFQDIEVLGNALDALSIENSVPKDIRFQILEKARDFEDNYILNKIGRCIAVWGKDDVARSLEIIKNIAIKDYHRIPGDLIWALKAMSKDSVEESLEIVGSWLTGSVSDSEKMWGERFLYPHFLMILTEDHRDILVQRLNQLSQQGRHNNLVMATIQEYMGNLPRRKDWTPVHEHDDVCLQSCIDSLKTIALRTGKDASRFPSNNKKKMFQCGDLIELIGEVEYEPDPNLVMTALDNYPNIKRFVTVSVNENELESPPPTSFFKLVGSDRCSYREYLQRIGQTEIELSGGRLEVAKWEAYDALARQGRLSHIDNCLIRICPTEMGTKSIRDNLLSKRGRENEKFGTALSEIQVIGRLRVGLKTTISELSEVVTEDDVRIPKRPDISVYFGDDCIRIEVITPQMAAIIRYLGGGVIPNRLTGKIIDEFDEHFRGQTDDRDAMIVVDTGRSEIDAWSAVSSMKGSLAIQYLYDKSGKVVADRPVYARDSITDMEPETTSILGVLLYKEKISREGHLLLVGKFYPNIHSRAPEKMIFCRMIEEQLLDCVEGEPRI